MIIDSTYYQFKILFDQMVGNPQYDYLQSEENVAKCIKNAGGKYVHKSVCPWLRLYRTCSFAVGTAYYLFEKSSVRLKIGSYPDDPLFEVLKKAEELASLPRKYLKKRFLDEKRKNRISDGYGTAWVRPTTKEQSK